MGALHDPDRVLRDSPEKKEILAGYVWIDEVGVWASSATKQVLGFSFVDAHDPEEIRKAIEEAMTDDPDAWMTHRHAGDATDAEIWAAIDRRLKR